MKPLLLYLLQVIICSGLLYGYYHLMLRNKKFHEYNRYYLLAAAIISILIPFFNIPVYFSADETKPVWIETLNGLSSTGDYFFIATAHDSASTFFTRENMLVLLYVLVSVFVLYRFVAALLKIRKMTGKYPAEKLDGINFVNTEEAGTPFSFFRWLFWNKKIQLDSPDGQQIFRHELYHIRQKHSRDIIFIETLTVVFWINPFFHLLKKELTTIHEFLADQFAIKENEQWNYAELLLMHLMGSPNLRFTHPFFHNQLKRRIAMITSSKKPKYQYLRKVLALPLLALVALLFAFTYEQKKAAGDNVTAGSAIMLPASNRQAQEIVLTDSPWKKTNTERYTLKADKIILHSNDKNNGTKGIEPDLIIIDTKQYTRKELKEKFGDKVILVAGEVHVTPADNPEAIKKYGPAAKNGVIEFKKIKISKEVVIEKPLKLNKVLETKTGEPLVVIDEEVQLKENTKVVLSKISPGAIEQINVLKDKTATEKYGARGADGVIEITTKREGKPIPVEVRGIRIDAAGNETAVPGKNELSEVEVVGYANNPDKQPSFPGGETGWRKFLEKTLNANVPVDNGAPEGKYIVRIQFIVDMEGYISDIKPLTRHGYGMEDEVIRVLKNGPRWEPGKIDGKAVKAFKQQPVTFVIEGEPDMKEKEIVVVDYTKENPVTAAGMEKLSPIYPNPASNIVTIPFNTQLGGAGEIRVQDTNGQIRLVTKTTLVKGLNNLNLNVASLAKGVYIISVTDANKNPARVYKLVKQ